MTGKFTFLVMGCSLATLFATAQYQPAVLTGFNADIIANGVGPATGSTTANADNASYGLVSKDFQLTATSAFPTYGLPTTGIINSATTTGVSFQLASYTGNNALRLVTGTTTGTLNLVTPRTATDIFLLAYSGSGASTATVTITFADATTQVSSISVADWYSGTPVAIQGIGRVSLSGDNLLDGTSTNPRLYEQKIALTAANYNKQITGITVTKTNVGTSLLGVLGLVTYINPIVYTAVSVTGFNADVIANGTGAPANSTTSDVDAATPPYVFVSADYKYTATCTAPTRSLPLNGLITSNLTSGLTFQLPGYDGNNDLRLTGTNSGTLTFGSPTAAQTVYLLTTGGSGPARINATVTFSDNTTQAFSNLDIGDWYIGTTNIATQGVGRVPRNVTACASLEISTTYPQLYQIPLAISTPNSSKLISSVTITRVDGINNFAGIANIMAVSVSNPNPGLPVSLRTVSGYRTVAGNQLQWTTVNEQNNAGFDVERSGDGIHFQKIAFVDSKAPNGNSNAEITYSITDKNDLNSATYYRLKQVDKDGKATYSRIVFIKALKSGHIELAVVYPNPVKDQLQVQITSAKNERLTLVIVDAAGKVVLQKAVTVNEGLTTVNMDLPIVNAGHYFIKAIGTDGATGVSKFVKD